jgi:hypothetical protein
MGPSGGSLNVFRPESATHCCIGERRLRRHHGIVTYLSSMAQPFSGDNTSAAGKADSFDDIPTVSLLSPPKAPYPWYLPTREVCEQPVLTGRYAEDSWRFV